MMINCIIFFVISGFLKMPFDKKSWRKMKFANLPINIVPCSRLGCDRFVDFIKKGDTFFYFNCNCEGIVCSSCYSQSFCSHIPYECKYCGGTYDLALFRSKFNYLVPPRYLYWQQFLSRFQQFNPRISNWVIFSRMMHHCHHMLFAYFVTFLDFFLDFNHQFCGLMLQHIDGNFLILLSHPNCVGLCFNFHGQENLFVECSSNR